MVVNTFFGLILLVYISAVQCSNGTWCLQLGLQWSDPDSTVWCNEGCCGNSCCEDEATGGDGTVVGIVLGCIFGVFLISAGIGAAIYFKQKMSRSKRPSGGQVLSQPGLANTNNTTTSVARGGQVLSRPGQGISTVSSTAAPTFTTTSGNLGPMGSPARLPPLQHHGIMPEYYQQPFGFQQQGQTLPTSSWNPQYGAGQQYPYGQPQQVAGNQVMPTAPLPVYNPPQ